MPRITDKVMVITEHGDRDQIAVLEEDVLVQHYVTRTGARSMVGNVYLGRVQNVLPGMEAAFIDIGRGRNGVLYAGEVNYSPEDLEGPQPRIEQILKNGQSVMVQVTKDPMGGKGARLTAQISMPGRFLVFVPNANISGISRRLPDEERRRLKTIMKKVRPEGHGVIVRTAAEGASEEALTADLQRLVREWDDIQKQSKRAKAPAGLYEEPELTVRVVRDLFTDEEFKELATDSPRVYEKVLSYVHDVAPDLEPKVHLHQGRLPAFEEYRIVEQIHKALDKKVWLPSGGYLFIERTEAMTIIDVNTGQERRQDQPRGDRDQHEPRGSAGGRAAAPPAGHRGHHRDRLHRYAPGEEQDAGRDRHEGGPGRRQDAIPGVRDRTAGVDAGDPQAGLRRSG